MLISLLNFGWFCSAHLSNWLKFFWRAAQHSGVLPLLPALCHQWICWGGICTFSQIFDEEVKQYWAHYWTFGETTNDKHPTGHCATDDSPLGSAIQTVLHPPHCPLTQSTLPEFVFVIDNVEILAEVGNIRCCSLIHPYTCFIVEAIRLVTFAVKIWMMFAFSQSSGTSPEFYNLSKMIMSSPVVSASSLNIDGCIPLGPMDLWISTSPKWSLNPVILEKEKVFLVKFLIPLSWVRDF